MSKTITITEDKFAEAVANATVKFAETANKSEVSPIQSVALSLQNALFGALVHNELFGEKDENEINIEEDK